jgi:hypothetical protein
MIGNDVTLSAYDELTLSASTFSYDTGSNYNFKVNNNSILSIDSNGIRVNGDVQFTGAVNSIVVDETTLRVEDKQVKLAYNPDSNVTDGVSNEGAGIVVLGLPSDHPTESNNPQWQKSILWNFGNSGTEALGTANIADESYWDVRGGSLRLSVTKSNGDDVAFVLRINDLDELEIVKRYHNGSMYVMKRVAKYGRVIS